MTQLLWKPIVYESFLKELNTKLTQNLSIPCLEIRLEEKKAGVWADFCLTHTASIFVAGKNRKNMGVHWQVDKNNACIETGGYDSTLRAGDARYSMDESGKQYAKRNKAKKVK